VDSNFVTGYYVGAALFIGLVGLVFWYVGRWGWIGFIIRIGCGILIVLKVIQVMQGR
jgi:hypothetical protein